MAVGKATQGQTVIADIAVRSAQDALAELPLQIAPECPPKATAVGRVYCDLAKDGERAQDDGARSSNASSGNAATSRLSSAISCSNRRYSSCLRRRKSVVVRTLALMPAGVST